MPACFIYQWANNLLQLQVSPRNRFSQIYVVICERCANLMDAADEMERLMLTEFKNICLNE